MAEITHLEEKVGEVLGLAQAAQQSTKRVRTLAKKEKNERLVQQLNRMVGEAQKTEQRTKAMLDKSDLRKTAVNKKARETKSDAQGMMKAYLEGKDEALDGLEFLMMAEAGELGHWQILGTMNKKAGNKELQKLVDWATPIQERHFATVSKSALTVAAAEDPNETA